jgi:hypothetical protein
MSRIAHDSTTVQAAQAYVLAEAAFQRVLYRLRPVSNTVPPALSEALNTLEEAERALGVAHTSEPEEGRERWRWIMGNLTQRGYYVVLQPDPDQRCMVADAYVLSPSSPAGLCHVASGHGEDREDALYYLAGELGLQSPFGAKRGG